tara:strand:- start:56203 stop:57831 length:1629 start_codon:yes stop_codon:yes gene_type:complete
MARSPNENIVIIGGGPIGMSLALDLAYRGVSSTIIEKTDGRIETPKLGLISVRTMEIFRRLGLNNYVKDTKFKRDYGLSMVYCTSIATHFLGKIPYPSLQDEPSYPGSPETKWRCSQIFLNPMLEERVNACPQIDYRTMTQFERFEDKGDKVIVHVRDLENDTTSTLSTPYLIGCDGAGSRVRRQLEIDMLGEGALDHSVAIFFRSSALASDHKMGEAERYFFVDDNGWWGNISAMDGYELWRLTVSGADGKSESVVKDAAAWVRRALGSDDIPFELISALPWRRSQLTAAEFSKGRVFIAGDSAHTMSPTGGLGMNTGMGDVNNLAWKITASLEGWGGDTLLNSYTIERRPIAERNASVSTHNFNQLKSVINCTGILEETPEGERIRERIGAQITGATKTEWETMGVHLGYRYEASPILASDGTDEPYDDHRYYVPTARPGHRAPHVWLGGGPPNGLSTLDLFGPGFVLLRLGTSPQSCDTFERSARKRNIPLRVIDLDQADILELYESPLVLVRPDGHVAWRGQKPPEDAEKLWDIVTGA